MFQFFLLLLLPLLALGQHLDQRDQAMYECIRNVNFTSEDLDRVIHGSHAHNLAFRDTMGRLENCTRGHREYGLTAWEFLKLTSKVFERHFGECAADEKASEIKAHCDAQNLEDSKPQCSVFLHRNECAIQKLSALPGCEKPESATNAFRMLFSIICKVRYDWLEAVQA